MLGLEATLLGRREALAGDGERVEIEQGLLCPLEPLFEPCAQRGEGGRVVGMGTNDTEGLGEQRGALGLRGHAVGGEQGEGLTGGQAGPLGGALESLLLLGRQRAEGVSERRPELVAIDLVAQRLGELACEEEAARHPTRLAARALPHRGLGQTVIDHEGVDGARLVHRGETAWGRVGAEEQELVFHRG